MLRRTPPKAIWAAAEGQPISKVILTKNGIREFPHQLAQFGSTLTILELAQNKLAAIPSEIGLLTSLACLDVRGNVLSTLPAELTQCKGLEEVVCSMNRFGSIPVCLYSIPAITSLVFADNQIGAIDVPALRRLPKLICLELTNNSINQVPPKLGLLEGLSVLKLEGNCFKIPRPAQLAQPTAALLVYLRGRIA